jgi:hypothetical protein
MLPALQQALGIKPRQAVVTAMAWPLAAGDLRFLLR